MNLAKNRANLVESGRIEVTYFFIQPYLTYPVCFQIEEIFSKK